MLELKARYRHHGAAGIHDEHRRGQRLLQRHAQRGRGRSPRALHEDAQLVTPFGTFVGVHAIVAFYRDYAFSVDRLVARAGSAAHQR